MRELVEVGFIRCGKCGKDYTSVEREGEGFWRCYKCKTLQKFGKWKIRKVPARRCPSCNHLVSITSDNISNIGLMCPGCRYNWYTKRYLQKEKILKATREQLARSVRVQSKSRNLVAKSWRDYGVLTALIDEARNEAPSFRFTPFSHRRIFTSWLFIVGSDFAGYVSWNRLPSREPCLRQIFVRDQFRHRGIATSAISRLNAKADLVIESPNDATLSILTKMGYAKLKGNNVEATRVKFIQAM